MKLDLAQSQFVYWIKPNKFPSKPQSFHTNMSANDVSWNQRFHWYNLFLQMNFTGNMVQKCLDKSLWKWFRPVDVDLALALLLMLQQMFSSNCLFCPTNSLKIKAFFSEFILSFKKKKCFWLFDTFAVWQVPIFSFRLQLNNCSHNNEQILLACN